MDVSVVDLPDNIFDDIISNCTFEEVSRMRVISRKFDSAARRILKQGSRAVLEFIDYFLQREDEDSEDTPISELLSAIAENCSDEITPLLGSFKTLYGVIETITNMTNVECCGVHLGQILDETFKVFWDIENCRRNDSDVSPEKIAAFVRDLEITLMDVANFVYAHKHLIYPIYLPAYLPHLAELEETTHGEASEPALPELQEQIDRITRQNNENKVKIDGLAKTVSDLKKEFKNSSKKLEELRNRLLQLENKIATLKKDRLEASSGGESSDSTQPSTSRQSEPPAVIPEPSDDTQFPPDETSDESHAFEPVPTTSTHLDRENFVRPWDFSGSLPPRKKSKISTVRKPKKLLHFR